MAPTTGAPRRRRRTSEEAAHEIVEAAEAFLRERPFRDLTVDEVMRRTALSRPSFYVHFRDRHDLVLRVTQHIGAELFEVSDRWYKGEGDGPALVQAAVEGVVGVYERHGPVLRALADAAADDPRVEETYGGLVRSFVDATAQHVARETAAGRMPPLPHPDQVATALVATTEGYLRATLGRTRTEPAETIVAALATVWIRTLYLR